MRCGRIASVTSGGTCDHGVNMSALHWPNNDVELRRPPFHLLRPYSLSRRAINWIRMDPRTPPHRCHAAAGLALDSDRLRLVGIECQRHVFQGFAGKILLTVIAGPTSGRTREARLTPIPPRKCPRSVLPTTRVTLLAASKGRRKLQLSAISFSTPTNCIVRSA